MNKLLSLCLTLLISTQLFAQDNPPLLGFDIKPSNSGPSFINDIAKDASGNIYVAGVFGGTMETYGLTSAGGNDIFFAKFNSVGSLVWIKQIGGTGDDQAISIAFDQTGSTIFLGGVFSGTVDFDPNAGTAALTSGGGRDPFLGRYTTDGLYMWIGNISGAADGQIRDIVCTSTDVYVTGLFYGTVDFGFGGGVSNQTSLGVADAFIARYAMTSGTINNIRIIGGAAGEDYGYSIATDASSNIYITGVYNGTVNFGNTNLTSTGNMDMFCAKYTSNLSPVWAVSSGVNATNDFGKAITVDGSGNVYITGSWYTGVWIQKFNPSGVSQWSTSLCQFGGGIGEGESIVVNTDGDVVVAGYFNSSTGFAGVCSGPYYFTSQGNNDSFVAKYKGVDGAFKWVKTISTTGPEEYRAITSDATNNFITAGYWATSVSNYSLQITKYFDDPPSQPAALTFSNVTTSGFNATYAPTFSQPLNGQGGFIIVRKTGSAPMDIPPDGIAPESYFDFGGAEILGSSTVIGYSYTGSATSFIQTSALPNTQYYYAIYAFNGYGNYLQTNPLRGSQFTLATESTAQPTNLTFNSFTQTSFNATFTASSGGAAGYLVLRKTGSAPTGLPSDATAYIVGATIGDGVVAYSGPLTTFSQAALTAGTAYYYQVFSYNGSGQSLNYRTISPLSNNTITTPPNPTAIAATSTTQNGFTANWNSSTSATSYRLDVSSDNFATFITLYNNKTVAGISDPVNGLNPNTNYKYRVRAVNASGTSGNSNEISQITITATPVATSATLFSQNGFTANWNSVAGATGYKLDVSDNNLFSSFVSGFSNKDVAGTNSIVSGLNSGVTYYYRVRSYNPAGTSPNSNVISQITLPDAPVANSATLISQTQFQANWNSVTGAVSYLLDVSLDGFVSFISGYNSKPVSTISDLVTGLSPGQVYQYRVRAVNSAGTSGNSNTISQVTIPPAPAPIASNFSQTGFRISWPAVPTAIDYLVDVSQDNFTTFLLEAKTVTTTLLDVIGLSAGTNYQYRVRSRNLSGTSPNSSTFTQITIPANPVSNPFSNATASSFIANWEVVGGATGYEIDVTLASDNFASFVTGYNAKQVPNVGDFIITGLNPSTSYRYRVRAFNSAGVSDNSLSRLAVTTDASGGGAPTLPAVTVVENQNSQSSVKSSVSGGFGAKTIVFKHRKITEANFTSETSTTLTGTSYEAPIVASFLDEIGMEYYFQVTDELDKISESNRAYVYKTVSSQSIPLLASAGTLSSYRIISVPLKLESKDIRDVFAPLISLYGGYNKEKWRLLRYQNGKNTDYDGLSRIDEGKGYWFNSLESVDIKLSGQALPVNQANPFQLQLDKGWNQIGSPFLFDIDWDDIRAANSSADVDADYLVFDAGSVSFKKSNSIKSWSGGFVYANSSQTLQLPVTLKNTAGGRTKETTDMSYSLDQPNWFVPITLTHAEGLNDYSGFGMHPEASNSKDRFDGQTVPRFINYLELNSYHEEAFTPRFARDVVPAMNSYTWTFTAESNFSGVNAELKWDPSVCGINTAQLLLYDIGAQVLVDMRERDYYKFELSEKRQFKIYYSIDEKSLRPDLDGLGKAYPNPFIESVTIPFITSEPDRNVEVAVYDLLGKKIKSLVNDRFAPGHHEASWDGKDNQNVRVSQGIYLYQLISGNNTMMGKLILR